MQAGVSVRSTTAFVLFAVVVAELLAVLLGAALTGMSGAAATDSFMVTNTALGVGCGAGGVLIAANRPENLLGWLLLGAGVCQTATAAVTPWFVRALHDGAPDVVIRSLSTAYSFCWPWSVALFIPLTLLYFPNGRLPGGRWRRLLPVVVLNGVVQVLLFSADERPLSTVRELDAVDRPAPSYLTLGWLSPDGAIDIGSEVVLSVTFGAGLVALVLRYRRGNEPVRRQLLWLLLATAVTVVLVAVSRLSGRRLEETGFPVVALTGIALIPVAITIAVVRHQLLDIRLLWLRTITYSALTAIVVVAYLVIVGVTDQILRPQLGLGSSVLATVAVAAAFNPVRVRLQRGVERLLYGHRADPVRAATSVTADLAAGVGGPADVLPALCEALRLPYARLTDGGRTLGEHGARPAIVELIPLVHAGVSAGELEIGVRSGQRRLDAADRAVLDLLAVPIGVAVRAHALNQEVQSSRRAIVAGREEERRRLRADLHDGLGPVLTGIAFQADAVVNLAATDPEQVRELGGEIRAAVGDVISDVRDLIYQLRPAALDEVGLVEAVRRHARRLDRRADGAPLSIAVSAATLPALPAAVEVAAYRIVTESLTNAVRHSTAAHVDVVITCWDDALHLRICDDGGGSVTPWALGVGLRSLRDRAAELGGTFEAVPTDAGGLVTSCLPVDVAG